MTNLVILRDRFLGLFEQHVHKLAIRYPRATGFCPLHQERTPSFSADIEKGIWHCFGCGASGGVRKFAELVGEPWGYARSESRTARAAGCLACAPVSEASARDD